MVGIFRYLQASLLVVLLHGSLLPSATAEEGTEAERPRKKMLNGREAHRHDIAHGHVHLALAVVEEGAGVHAEHAHSLHRPHMLNSKREQPPVNEDGASMARKHKHHSGDSWRLLSLHGDDADHPPKDHVVAAHAKDGDSAASEDAAEEQGPTLRDRKREFRSKMQACTELKIFSERTRCLHRVKIETHRAERQIRATNPSAPAEPAESTDTATDEMGRTMPILFGGKPQPIAQSGASLTTTGYCVAVFALVALFVSSV